MGFRPPQWSKPLLTSMEVSEQSVTTLYYFDAVFQLDHQQGLRHTEHPVQSGASVVDHAYLTPGRVVLEIGMSDVMDRYSPGLYTSDKSKSVSAYKTFLSLQNKRLLVTLNTRLKKYQNMLIEDVRALDDNETVTALRARISFYELLVGTVTSSTVSANVDSDRPDQTSSTNEGTKQPQPLPQPLADKLDELRHAF